MGGGTVAGRGRRRLRRWRLPIAPVNTVRDILADPHLRARAGVETVPSSESGPVHSPAPTPRLFGTPAARRGHTPDVGEDTDTILGRSGKAPD